MCNKLRKEPLILYKGFRKGIIWAKAWRTSFFSVNLEENYLLYRKPYVNYGEVLIPGSGRSAGKGIGYPLVFLGFPCGSAGKQSSCNAGDLGSIPGLGRSPGEGKGYPLQYSALENPMDSIVHEAMGLQRVGHDWAALTSLIDGVNSERSLT